MYFNVYSITKNEFDSRDTALKLYHNSSPLYFQNVTEFYDYIKNKTISFEQIVYFDVYVNLIKNEFYYTPHIHSINFNKEPIMDNSIRSFNSFAKKEQQEIVKDMISNVLENDDFKDMKQPSFYCKPVYFKMDNIQMKDFLEYTENGIRYKPTLWGGRTSNMNMENVKETFNMLGNEEIITFLENIKECLMEYKDHFKEKLLDMKKLKKVSKFLKKMILILNYLSRNIVKYNLCMMKMKKKKFHKKWKMVDK